MILYILSSFTSVQAIVAMHYSLGAMEAYRVMQPKDFQYPFERIDKKPFFKTELYDFLKTNLYRHRGEGTMGVSSLIYEYERISNHTSSMSGQ